VPNHVIFKSLPRERCLSASPPEPDILEIRCYFGNGRVWWTADRLLSSSLHATKTVIVIYEPAERLRQPRLWRSDDENLPHFAVDAGGNLNLTR